MVKIGVVGGTGYTGVELLRILAQHPQADLRAITSRKEAGMAVSELFPSLRGHVDIAFSDPATSALDECDVVFFATPHAVAMNDARRLVEAGVRIIDISADFRIQDVAEWEKWYKVKHACPELIPQAVYGLPEVNRDAIRKAPIVANPGCYPTAVQLGLLPLLEAHAVDAGHLIADAKSGVSGAGRKAETHILFAEASDNFKAYGVPGHRHGVEIVQCLSRIIGSEIGLTFVPHLTPMIRGIQCRLVQVSELGMHTQFVGEVMDAKADASIIGAGGAIDIKKLKPLVFTPDTQDYYGIGAHKGKVFSAGKGI